MNRKAGSPIILHFILNMKTRFLIVLTILLAVVALVEVYTFQVVKTLFRPRWVHWSYVLLSVLVYGIFFYNLLTFDRKVGQTQATLMATGLFLLFTVPKLLIVPVLFFEDVIRVFIWIKDLIGNSDSSPVTFTERRKFVSQIALGIAAVPFLSLFYGMTKGKYNFKVRKETLHFPDLPNEFDGFTLTQISDIHSGSFDDAEKIQHAIDLINAQESDLLLFTGDIVNNHADEMEPWIAMFKSIRPHTYGKFSVLGNHDYGEYLDWDSPKEKEQNFQNIKDLHQKIDFKLLLNEHVKLQKDAASLAIVGVENWGVKFKKAGDLAKAGAGLTAEDFKILMSHDPSHWDVEVKNHPDHYQLTLSGHTHGFQFGIEIPGWLKWSPVKYVYNQWAGLYENASRYIYVNRGFGFHAYPGRVGIMPEITVIELKKGKSIA